MSIHKTGGALTQASALLINNKSIDVKKVLQTINMLTINIMLIFTHGKY